jgi:hypothetical protein
MSVKDKPDITDNKRFWEELIANFPFTIIWVSDMRRRKRTLIRMRNEVCKIQHNLRGFCVG